MGVGFRQVLKTTRMGSSAIKFSVIKKYFINRNTRIPILGQDEISQVQS